MRLPHTSYAPHETYVAPARAQNDLWRLLPGAALILGVYLASLFLLGVYLAETYGRLIAAALMQRIAEGATPGTMLLLLWSFLGLAAGPVVAVRLVHRRRAGTLFGPSAARTLSDLLKVALPVAALHTVLLPLTLGADAVQPGLTFDQFTGYLPFALPGLLIQTGAEELVFRGYLQQQLAARFRQPVIWMGVPSALFAVGHYLPADYGANAWAVALWAGMFGLLAADLTARTGTLGAAIGLHFASNLAALLLVALDGTLDGLALWSLPLDLSDPAVAGPALATDFAAMITSWLLARLVLRV